MQKLEKPQETRASGEDQAEGRTPEIPAKTREASVPPLPSAFRFLPSAVWRFPLGWQLSALYAVLLVVTLSLVGALVYSQQESFLVQDVAQRLEQEASRIAALPPPPQPSDTGRTGPGQRPEQSESAAPITTTTSITTTATTATTAT